MKFFRQASAIVFFAAFSLVGRGEENSSVTIDSVLQHVVERAKTEAAADRAFEQNYSYSREKITDVRTGNGVLVKHEDKNNVHQPTAAKSMQNTDPHNLDKKEATVDGNSNVHGQAFKKNDFMLNQDLISRFSFTLAGTEMLNGRQMYVIDFVPAKKNLPEHDLKDRFINKAAGRVWVDAQDYALVKADLHLTKPVDVAWGLIGSVWKFNYGFDRERTEDGYWFTRDVNWHLEGRAVVVNRTADYHESTSNLQKVNAIAAR